MTSMRLLTLQKIFSLALFFGIAGLCNAQVANDRCENATVMTLGANSSECTPVAGTTIGAEDATLIAGPVVCSGSWYSDDVWFQFTTDANPPANGIIVESILGAGDAPELGMAVYDGCDPTNEPFDCFSDSPGRRTLTLLGGCVEPNKTYYVRCWSTGDPAGGAPNLNAGTFSICAYGAEASEPSTDVVIWSEDFSDGPGDFTTIALPESMDEDCEYDWVWNENGSVLTYGNTAAGTITLASSACNGAMGFPAGFYQTGCSGLIGDIPPDYNNYIDFAASLVSPPIDLSENACVTVKWNENFQGLNPSTNSSWGSYFEYSIDGGIEWQGIDLNETDDRNIEYIRDREFPLFGAGGQSDVRLRFTFDGDFYWWIIDNVQIIERRDNDLRAQENFYAIAPLSTMPVTQIDEVNFLIDVLNRGCDTQTNTTVNCTCVDDNSGAEVFNEDLAYGSVDSDSLAQNKAFTGSFTPAAGVVTTYTCTYTVSADSDDDNPDDNTQSFTFAVSDEMQFRKEEGRTRGLLPLASSFWEDGENHSWEIGNVFYTTGATNLDGGEMHFTSIDFGIENPGTLGGERVSAWLYTISDNDFNGVVDKQDPSEIQRLGVGEYQFTGFEVDQEIINVPIESLGGPLVIEAGKHYFASIEFTTQLVGIDMNISASEEFDYGAAMYMTRTLTDPEITPPASINDIRYSHGFGITKEGTLRFTPTTDITTLNFGDDLVPVVRLNFEDYNVSTRELSDDIAIEVFPNPASVEINLNLDITETAEELNVQIVDIAGKVVLSRDYDNVKTMKEAYNISNLSDGIYFMHINTSLGIQTKRIVVAK